VSELIPLIPELLKLRPFAGVPGPALHNLLEATTSRTLTRGEVLAEAGTKADHAWLVVRGRLGLEAGSSAHSIGEVWPGEMVGEESVWGTATTRVSTIRATQDTLVLQIDRGTVGDASLAANPAMGALQRHMMRISTRRLHALDNARHRALVASHTFTEPPPDLDEASEPSTPLTWLRALFGGDR